MFPIATSLVVPVFNLPFLSLNDRVILDRCLNVNNNCNSNREVLADIFLGNITMWNDVRILNSNPGIASLFPNETIHLVIR